MTLKPEKCEVTPVALGLMVRDGSVFVGRRVGDPLLNGFWEFPGGKIRFAEHPEDAVVRELKEELNVSVKVGKLVFCDLFHYEDRSVLLMAYLCDFESAPSKENTIYRESRWALIGELAELSMPPANEGIKQALIRLLDGGAAAPGA